MIIETAISIEDERFIEGIENIEDWCQKICVKAWEIAVSYDNTLPNEEIEISILLTDDKQIQEINKNYRGKDKPTNVISFASLDSEEVDVGAFSAGDIIISYDTTLKESSETGFKNHFTHLLVHGVLHLAGFDHIDDDEADEMEHIEAKILEAFNINNPYIE